VVEASLIVVNEACPCGVALEPLSMHFVVVQVKGDEREYMGTAYCSEDCVPEGLDFMVVKFDG
jgi:hypothetical protein